MKGTMMRHFAAVFLMLSCLGLSAAWAQQPGYPFPQHPTAQPGAPGPGAVPPPLPARPQQEKPPQPPVVTQYYVEENGGAVGPLSFDQIQQRVRAGQLRQTDLIWKSGLAQWVEAKTLPELRNAFAQTPPPAIPAEARIKKFLVGVWRTEATHPALNATIRTTIRYHADGSFTGTQSVLMPGLPSPTTVPLQGTWKVTVVTDREFALTLTEPGNPMPISGTLVIVDDNTVQNKEDGSFGYRVG